MGQTTRLERVGVEQLIAPATVIGDQQSRFTQCHQLGERIGPGAGKHDIRAGKCVGQIGVQVFELAVPLHSLQLCGEVPLAADMQHVKPGRDRRKRFAQHGIDRLRTERTADHHQHRFASAESGQLEAPLARA